MPGISIQAIAQPLYSSRARQELLRYCHPCRIFQIDRHPRLLGSLSDKREGQLVSPHGRSEKSLPSLEPGVEPV